MSDSEFESPMRSTYKPRSFDDVLKYAIYNKEKVVKGLKETLKAIETGRAKVVFIALNAPLETYKTVIKQYCSIFCDNSTNYIFEVEDWMKLRNAVFEYSGKEEFGHNPKCYCACILYPSKEEERERRRQKSTSNSPKKVLKRQEHLFKKMIGNDTLIIIEKKDS
jgi:ribosomal protein L7Ae-like RNA K-turn-binding protein